MIKRMISQILDILIPSRTYEIQMDAETEELLDWMHSVEMKMERGEATMEQCKLYEVAELEIIERRTCGQ